MPIHGDVITDLGLGLFADVDLVIGCLDNREARLWVNRQCWKVGTPWIDAGIQEIQGVVKVFVPPDSACYECGDDRARLPAPQPPLQLPAADARRDPLRQGPHRPHDRLDDGGACRSRKHSSCSTACRSPAARPWFSTASRTSSTATRLPFREDCLSHETYPRPAELSLGHAATVADLLAAARTDLEGPLALALDRELVVAIDCPRCGWRAGGHASPHARSGRRTPRARTASNPADPR